MARNQTINHPPGGMLPLEDRARLVKGGENVPGAVGYWMSRDQRAHDNWALLHAQKLALENRVPLIVLFCLAPEFIGASAAHYSFMLAGLRETARDCASLNIPFVLLTGDPSDEIPRAADDFWIAELVTDFDPLRVKRGWLETVASRIHVHLHEVDAHNIVPAFLASDKREYSAATIRRKIHRLLPSCLHDIPAPEFHPWELRQPPAPPDWDAAAALMNAASRPAPPAYPSPGPAAAHAALETFIAERLHRYDAESADPNADAVSGLSPYLHFGQLSAQRAALSVIGATEDGDANAAAFLEQLIVRRELSDNFCLYEPAYDTLDAAPDWARRTLDEHRDDPREYVYDYGVFEDAATHDPLWNAAQTELLATGTIHGYMRMYWAKKILEWTPDPETALDIALTLNDRHALDGRDPNGYVGVMWSIAGVHDRAWSERSVYGKIRYMSEGGCRRKFDAERYVERMRELRD